MCLKRCTEGVLELGSIEAGPCFSSEGYFTAFTLATGLRLAKYTTHEHRFHGSCGLAALKKFLKSFVLARLGSDRAKNVQTEKALLRFECPVVHRTVVEYLAVRCESRIARLQYTGA